MEVNKEKSILPLDYDDDDSSEEEEDEELFDNSKVDWRVKGNLLRGKEFSVSENGNCPRCQSNIIVFVILDELFPMGDMPEILYNLLAKGKAVLWSSQDKQSCKKSPTFMCKGFCPPDPLGAGFNINWDTVNLTKLLKDLLKLNIAKAQKKLQESEKENEEDEDVDEKDIIKAMLAKEQEKEEKEKTVYGPLKEDDAKKSTSETVVTTSSTPITTTSSSAVVTSSASSASYPVSKDGSCPHCGSTMVRYIILVKDSTKDITLPPTLDKLLKIGKAFKMAKGANNPPSFQCCSCTYGFNLDWSKTNLKKIFNLENETSTSSTTSTTTTATSSTAATSTTYQDYTTSTSYSTISQTSSYGSYAYTQPPPMGYTTPSQYGYPTAAPMMGQPVTRMVPPMGGMAPSPYGAPIPYPGAPQPYPGIPPQPYGLPPPPGAFMGPPQPYPGAPPNSFGAAPPGSMLAPVTAFQPPRGGAPIYGMQPSLGPPGTMQGQMPGIVPRPAPMQIPGLMQAPGSMQGAVPMQGPMPMRGPIPMQGPPGPYPVNPQGMGGFPGNMQGPGNMQLMPRLRVPKGPRGRNKNWKKSKGQQGQQVNNQGGSEQWTHEEEESQDNEGEEDTSEDLYDPEAATRFEELLNKIDDQEDHNGDGDDEKPPGEETQAEFVVTAFTPEEKTKSENIAKNIKSEPNVETTQANNESIDQKKSETMQQDVKTEIPSTPEVVPPKSDDAPSAPEVIPCKAEVTNDGEPTVVSGNDNQTSIATDAGNGEVEKSVVPRSKATRGRKRPAGGRKKTPARNTRKKVVEDTSGSEDTTGNNNDTDGLVQTEVEVKKAKVDGEVSQEGTGAEDEVAATTEETKPKRVTRARSQRKKK